MVSCDINRNSLKKYSKMFKKSDPVISTVLTHSFKTYKLDTLKIVPILKVNKYNELINKHLCLIFV